MIEVNGFAVAVDAIGNDSDACHVVDFYYGMFGIFDIECRILHIDADFFLFLFNGGALDVLCIHSAWYRQKEDGYNDEKYLFLHRLNCLSSLNGMRSHGNMATQSTFSDAKLRLLFHSCKKMSKKK